jgi:sugar fermentation stimulation protein A
VILFTNDREAVFIRRPNRFLIIAQDRGEEIPCHCPNPGRLMEFFGPRGYDIPGARLILERRRPAEGAAGALRAKTAWTAAGLYYRGGTAPLFSARANRAADELILPRLIPGLREIRGEYTQGNSRFDFLCRDRQGRRHLVEVKACSLVEHGTAMFPDAPSGRALKHLEELALLSGEGYHCHVLFVIVHGSPRCFIPNLHTDPELALALGRLGRPAGERRREDRAVEVHAALLRCDPRGRAELAEERVPVDLSHGELAAANGGSYLILLELTEETRISVGALGELSFEPGWYVYAGSARKNLSQRMARHLRRVRKERHWHLDYLSPAAKTLMALPIASYRNLECALAGELRRLGARPVRRFGSSDCRCESPLWFFPGAPLKNRDFVDMLFHFRHQEAFFKGRGPL